MALRRHNNDRRPFPTPDRRIDVYYPQTYRDYYTYPYRRGAGRDYSPRRSRYSGESKAEQKVCDLVDKSLKHNGDLGWSLDYAAAWCYKFLVGNQTEVADVIDKVRDLEDVEARTPMVIFDYLDNALFGDKLKRMVFLRWKAQASTACGTTSAPGVVAGIPRICIELNSLPFEEGDGGIDDLLDALIHHMIHAFFLVCCGALPKHAEQDGRLADGVHFGVILFTIREITKQCRDGFLDLTFYAVERREHTDPYNRSHHPNTTRSGRRRPNPQASWISIDPRGGVVAAPPADGQTHCSHDNRSIRRPQLKNWQVEHYSRAIDLEMDQKGDVIYDLGVDNKLVPTERIKGPPSSTYIELIWDGKRIMIPREKTLKFKSLKKPLEKDGKYELKIPESPMSVLRLLYDFIQHKVYWEEPAETIARTSPARTKGPPILLPTLSHHLGSDIVTGMVDHIKVFKTAESMKFEELQAYALKRLYDMPTTCDDPIEALKELYNEKSNSQPIHAELHKWARKFLARTEDVLSSHSQYSGYDSVAGYSRRDAFCGLSNYEKLLQSSRDRFEELYHRNMALKDDCKLVHAQLLMSDMGLPTQPEALWNYSEDTAPRQSLATIPSRPLVQARSWNRPLALDYHYSDPIASRASSISGRSLDDIAVPVVRPTRLLEYTTPTLSDLPSNSVGHKFYGRDGGLNSRDALTGKSTMLGSNSTVLEI